MRHLKKFILATVNKILWARVIQKPASAFLAKHPRLKQSAKKIVIRYFIGSQPQALKNPQLYASVSMSKTSATYQNLLKFTLQKNTYNIYQTAWVNKFLLALTDNDYGYLNQHNIKTRQTDLIISCYLYLLRRYPGQNDIDLWKNHLSQGASVEIILNALMASSEFTELGIYYLHKV